MADVEIKGRISVDTGNTQKSVNEMLESIKATKKALADAKVGSIEYQKAQADLDKQTKQLKDSLDKSGGSFSKLKETLNNTVPGFQGAAAGADSLNTKFWTIVKNPVGMILAAIVLGLTFLFKAFTSTEGGAKKFDQILAGLTATVQVITDRALSFGNALIKLFSGDFTGAAAEARNSIKGVGSEIQETYNKTVQLTKRLQELAKEEREDAVDKAKRERDLAKIREDQNDETIPIRIRLKNAKMLRDEQIKNAKDDLARSTEIAKSKIELYLMEKNGAFKYAQEIADLRKGIYNTERENAAEGIRTNKVIRNLEKQEKDEKQAILKDFDDTRKKHLENKNAFELRSLKLKQELELAVMSEGLEKELTIINNKLNDELAANKKAIAGGQLNQRQANILNAQITALANKDKLTAQEKAHAKEQAAQIKNEQVIAKIKTDFNKYLADERKKAIDKEFADRNKNLLDDIEKGVKRKEIADLEFQHKQSLYGSLSSIANTLSDELGRQTAAGKAIAVAGALIDTYAAIAGTLKNAAKTPMGGIPGYAIAQAIATGIFGLATVKKIVSVKVPNGSASSVSVPGSASGVTSVSAPIQPTSTNTRLDSTSIQGVGNAAGGGVNRAFVLESDIKNNRERSEMINRAARLS